MPWGNLARIALVLDAPKMLASFTYFATFPTILLLLFMCIRLIAHIEYYTIDFKSLVACGHLRRGWRRGNCDYVIYEKVHLRFFVVIQLQRMEVPRSFVPTKQGSAGKLFFSRGGAGRGEARPKIYGAGNPPPSPQFGAGRGRGQNLGSGEGPGQEHTACTDWNHMLQQGNLNLHCIKWS